jgi:hypothetical protein
LDHAVQYGEGFFWRSDAKSSAVTIVYSNEHLPRVPRLDGTSGNLTAHRIPCARNARERAKHDDQERD